MEKLKGVSVYEGIAIAPLYVLYEKKKHITQTTVSIEEIAHEQERFVEAIDKARADVSMLYDESQKKHDGESMERISKDILDMYILLLGDPDFHERVKRTIVQTFSNAEWAVKKVIRSYARKLEKSEDAYFAERVHDLNEIGIKIINHLSEEEPSPALSISSDCILVSNNLAPLLLVRLPRQYIKGIVLEEGGTTSHTSIIAKAYGIPMLTGVSEVLSSINDGVEAILDTFHSEIIINADKDTIASYKEQRVKIQEKEKALALLVQKTKHCTPEGEKLSFLFNLDVEEELDETKLKYADGIGLFRSEFLFETMSESHDSEEKQFSVYKRLVAKIPDKEVTIRTFDAGGDKISVSVNQINEENPLLGYRGIRYSLGDIEFFLCQIKALLRASCFGHLRILVPMVSNVHEMQRVHAVIARAKKILTEEGKEYRDDIPVGIMIEVPSVLYILPELAEYSDFFSVGTNDLLQYVMATDRDNAYTQYICSYYQPAFIRILRDIFYHAHILKKDISLCGEMASFIPTIPLLLGVGLRSFSVSPPQLYATIKAATSYKMSDARALVEKALLCKTERELRALVEDFSSGYSRNNR